MIGLAHWIIRLSPIYIVPALLLGMLGVPAWIILLPIFMIAVPAGFYLATWRCPHCDKLVYTPKNLKIAKDRYNKTYLHRFCNCPICNEKL